MTVQEFYDYCKSYGAENAIMHSMQYEVLKCENTELYLDEITIVTDDNTVWI